MDLGQIVVIVEQLVMVIEGIISLVQTIGASSGLFATIGGFLVSCLAVVQSVLIGLLQMGLIGLVVLFILFALVTAVILLFCSDLMIAVVEMYPLRKLSKKVGRPHGWMLTLSLLPTFGHYIRMYLVSDISDCRQLWLFGKRIFKNRTTAVGIYTLLGLFGYFAIVVLALILTFALPGIGIYSFILLIIPALIQLIIRVAILRDVMNTFRPELRMNRRAAVWVSILDMFTGGFGRAVYLFTLCNLTPVAVQAEIMNTVLVAQTQVLGEAVTVEALEAGTPEEAPEEPEESRKAIQMQEAFEEEPEEAVN